MVILFLSVRYVTQLNGNLGMIVLVRNLYLIDKFIRNVIGYLDNRWLELFEI